MKKWVAFKDTRLISYSSKNVCIIHSILGIHYLVLLLLCALLQNSYNSRMVPMDIKHLNAFGVWTMALVGTVNSALFFSVLSTSGLIASESNKITRESRFGNFIMSLKLGKSYPWYLLSH